MSKRITDADIAFAYELRVEYGMTWKQIGSFIGCTENHIIKLVSAKLRGE
jgi:hypothetical protein